MGFFSRLGECFTYRYPFETSLKMKIIRVLLTGNRPPDKVIWRWDGEPYMIRWHIIPRNRLFNIYFHNFRQSDDDRALHDHPWWSMSYILEGEYDEILPGPTFHSPDPENRFRNNVADTIAVRRHAGLRHLNSRSADSAHRVRLVDGKPVWTIFITKRITRKWGFYCPQGWVPREKFTDDKGNPQGEGCGA